MITTAMVVCVVLGVPMGALLIEYSRICKQLRECEQRARELQAYVDKYRERVMIESVRNSQRTSKGWETRHRKKRNPERMAAAFDRLREAGYITDDGGEK
jgi:hypothetical protein